MPTAERQEAGADFMRTLSVVDTIWGENAFRRWNPERGKWRNLILASLYDAQMIASRGVDVEKARTKRDEILTRFQQLFENEEFQKTIRASVPDYFKLRIQTVKDIIHDAIG